MSRVHSGPLIQQTGIGRGGEQSGRLQRGFSFQADGRKRGVAGPASLWEVNKNKTEPVKPALQTTPLFDP